MKPITPEKIAAAERMFPMPEFTRWYLWEFRNRVYALILASLVITGTIMTAFHAPHTSIGIVTLCFVIGMVAVAIIHTIAWVKMRRVEKSRAKWLGITLRKYWSL